LETLSAVIITLNEAHRIESCLGSLGFCDEIVLLDSGSSDGTLDLARRFTDRLYVEPFKGDGPQKNSALEKATGEWVLVVDGDEVIPPPLAKEIAATVEKFSQGDGPRSGRPSAWAVPRRNYFGEVWVRHGGWYPDHQIRLWPRGQVRYGSAKVHPKMVVDGPVARLKEPLDHYTYDSVEDYLERMERYARGKAEDYLARGRSCRPWTPAVHQGVAWVRTYLLRAGFLDGRLGWRLARLSARYTRLKYENLRAMRRDTGGRPAFPV